MTTATLGILGVGHLATYTVTGLRRNDDQRQIVLSPRNAEAAKQLANNSQCTIADNNQAVIDSSDIILLAVRPEQLDTLLNDLQIKPDTLVISTIAGVTLEQLKQYPALQSATLVRTLPSASAEVCAGPVPLFPANETAENLLNGIGTVVVLESEALFNAALAHGCLHGWSYHLVQQLIDWSKRQGMDNDTARTMVVESISSAIKLAESRPALNYGDIGNSIATPGTYTLKGINQIKANQGLEAWSDAMDSICKQR